MLYQTESRFFDMKSDILVEALILGLAVEGVS